MKGCIKRDFVDVTLSFYRFEAVNEFSPLFTSEKIGHRAVEDIYPVFAHDLQRRRIRIDNAGVIVNDEP